jgi:hypothetical protein
VLRVPITDPDPNPGLYAEYGSGSRLLMNPDADSYGILFQTKIFDKFEKKIFIKNLHIVIPLQSKLTLFKHELYPFM